MTKAIDLSPSELAIVRDILHAHLPPGTRVWVFGSRATASARRYSDLDLAVDWERPLGLDVLGQVAEALSESDLPFKVDTVDLRSIDPAFRASIASDMVELPF
jgi:type I restriction enzyme S subunit